MRTKIIFMLLFLSSIQVMGQNEIVITGNIIDKKTKEPLPYATIVHQNKSIGTVSNTKGNFTLTLLNAKESDNIIISYMGYKPIEKTISECMKTKTYKLEPQINELGEVVVTSRKINLKAFMRDVIKDYNKNRKDDPHIAIAHYREKAKEGGKYIMYMESIGFLSYSGKQLMDSPLLRYSFIPKNTRCHVTNPEWSKYKENCASNNENVLPGSGNNYNVFGCMEISGLLSNKDSKKYSYKIDSTYFIGNNAVYIIDFEKDNQKGKVHVFADSKYLIKIEWTTNAYFSNAFHRRVNANVYIQFNYFDNKPFVSSILAEFKKDNLEYQNYLEILSQKFNDIDIREEEYRGLSLFDYNPYIEYDPKEWITRNIENDPDYDKIEKDLTGGKISLEKYFENYSGRWFFKDDKISTWQESGISKIKQLERSF